MSTRRQQRVAEQIKIELSQLIEREIDDPRLNLINITDTTISPDLHDVTVFVSALAGESVKTAGAGRPGTRAQFLAPPAGSRNEGCASYRALHFRWDKSLEIGDRISRIIDQIEVQDPPSDPEPGIVPRPAHQEPGIIPSHQEPGIIP